MNLIWVLQNLPPVLSAVEQFELCIFVDNSLSTFAHLTSIAILAEKQGCHLFHGMTADTKAALPLTRCPL